VISIKSISNTNADIIEAINASTNATGIDTAQLLLDINEVNATIISIDAAIDDNAVKISGINTSINALTTNLAAL
jgi:septal ring factor EnvC (AmiA/AmiB activator)